LKFHSFAFAFALVYINHIEISYSIVVDTEVVITIATVVRVCILVLILVYVLVQMLWQLFFILVTIFFYQQILLRRFTLCMLSLSLSLSPYTCIPTYRRRSTTNSLLYGPSHDTLSILFAPIINCWLQLN